MFDSNYTIYQEFILSFVSCNFVAVLTKKRDVYRLSAHNKVHFVHFRSIINDVSLVFLKPYSLQDWCTNDMLLEPYNLMPVGIEK